MHDHMHIAVSVTYVLCRSLLPIPGIPLLDMHHYLNGSFGPKSVMEML